MGYPIGIDAGVVRDHIARQTYSPFPCAFPQGFESGLAAQFLSHNIIIQGVCRGDCVGIAAELFNCSGSLTAFPYTDEPQSRESPSGQDIQFGFRDVIQSAHFPL